MTFAFTLAPPTVRSFKLCSPTETRLARLSGAPRSCWRRQMAVAPMRSCGARTRPSPPSGADRRAILTRAWSILARQVPFQIRDTLLLFPGRLADPGGLLRSQSLACSHAARHAAICARYSPRVRQYSSRGSGATRPAPRGHAADARKIQLSRLPLCQGCCPLLYFSLIFRRAG